LTSRSHFFPHICEFGITHTTNSLKIQVLFLPSLPPVLKNPSVYTQIRLGKVILQSEENLSPNIRSGKARGMPAGKLCAERGSREPCRTGGSGHSI